MIIKEMDILSLGIKQYSIYAKHLILFKVFFKLYSVTGTIGNMYNISNRLQDFTNVI